MQKHARKPSSIDFWVNFEVIRVRDKLTAIIHTITEYLPVLSLSLGVYARALHKNVPVVGIILERGNYAPAYGNSTNGT